MRLMFLAPLLLAPLPASAFIAQNGMTARQIGPTEIAVDQNLSRNVTDYWCAAGDYARSVLGATSKTRIWRASSRQHQGGSGIVFTLDPAKADEDAGLSHFGSGPRDGSVSIGMAVGNYCQPYIPFWVE